MLSCIDGVGEPPKGSGVASSKCGGVESTFGVISLMSFTRWSGDSNMERGGGSMMGVVRTNMDVGTG